MSMGLGPGLLLGRPVLLATQTEIPVEVVVVVVVAVGILGSLGLAAACVVDPQLLHLGASIKKQTANGGKDDADGEEERQHRLGGQDGLPCFQSLLSKRGICGSAALLLVLLLVAGVVRFDRVGMTDARWCVGHDGSK